MASEYLGASNSSEITAGSLIFHDALWEQFDNVSALFDAQRANVNVTKGVVRQGVSRSGRSLLQNFEGLFILKDMLITQVNTHAFFQTWGDGAKNTTSILQDIVISESLVGKVMETGQTVELDVADLIVSNTLLVYGTIFDIADDTEAIIDSVIVEHSAGDSANPMIVVDATVGSRVTASNIEIYNITNVEVSSLFYATRAGWANVINVVPPCYCRPSSKLVP